ncbi:MAG: response regulator transcription factor [bacterium]
MKVLIVDDESDLANLLKINLEVEGFECSIAKDGQEGIEKAAAMQPDVILLDIRMPVIDGYGALAELKKNRETSKIPVIMCTTIKGEENIKKAHDLGASDYIIKPFEPGEVLAKIRKVLNS